MTFNLLYNELSKIAWKLIKKYNAFYITMLLSKLLDMLNAARHKIKVITDKYY